MSRNTKVEYGKHRFCLIFGPLLSTPDNSNSPAITSTFFNCDQTYCAIVFNKPRLLELKRNVY